MSVTIYRIGAASAALALLAGVLAVTSPLLAFAGILALGFVVLAAYDIAAGVAAFTILLLLEAVPPLAGSPAIKLGGAMLAILLVWRHLALLRLLNERRAIACLAVFLVAWAGATSLWAQDPGVAVASASRLALGVVFMFVVYAAIRERQHVRWLIYAFLAGGILTVIIGVAGITPTVAEGRFVGVVGQPNVLASILVPALALGGFALASGQDRKSQALIAMSLVVMIYALFLTGSRGGLVGLVVSLAMAVILGGSLRKHIVAVLVVVIGVGVGYYGVIAPPAAKARITNVSAEGGSTGRLDIWTVSTAVSADRPLLGVGAGNFPIVGPTYAAETANLSDIRFIVDTPKVVHNTYLEVLAEMGAPGLIAFLLMVGAAIASAVRAISAAHAAGDRELEFLGRGVAVALVGFLATATFGSYEYRKELWLLLGLATAMLYVVSHSNEVLRRRGLPNSAMTRPNYSGDISEVRSGSAAFNRGGPG